MTWMKILINKVKTKINKVKTKIKKLFDFRSAQRQSNPPTNNRFQHRNVQRPFNSRRINLTNRLVQTNNGSLTYQTRTPERNTQNNRTTISTGVNAIPGNLLVESVITTTGGTSRRYGIESERAYSVQYEGKTYRIIEASFYSDGHLIRLRNTYDISNFVSRGINPDDIRIVEMYADKRGKVVYISPDYDKNLRDFIERENPKTCRFRKDIIGRYNIWDWVQGKERERIMRLHREAVKEDIISSDEVNFSDHRRSQCRDPNMTNVIGLFHAIGSGPIRFYVQQYVNITPAVRRMREPQPVNNVTITPEAHHMEKSHAVHKNFYVMMAEHRIPKFKALKMKKIQTSTTLSNAYSFFFLEKNNPKKKQEIDADENFYKLPPSFIKDINTIPLFLKENTFTKKIDFKEDSSVDDSIAIPVPQPADSFISSSNLQSLSCNTPPKTLKTNLSSSTHETLHNTSSAYTPQKHRIGKKNNNKRTTAVYRSRALQNKVNGIAEKQKTRHERVVVKTSFGHYVPLATGNRFYVGYKSGSRNEGSNSSFKGIKKTSAFVGQGYKSHSAGTGKNTPKGKDGNIHIHNTRHRLPLVHRPVNGGEEYSPLAGLIKTAISKIIPDNGGEKGRTYNSGNPSQQAGKCSNNTGCSSPSRHSRKNKKTQQGIRREYRFPSGKVIVWFEKS